MGLAPVNNQTHVLCDDNLDGVFEVSFEDDAAAVSALGDTVTWNYNYTAASPP